MAPKGGSTAGSGADTRTYRAAYGQPKMNHLKNQQIGTNPFKNGGNIVPVNVFDDVRAIWQEFNNFQFVSNVLSYEQGI